MRAVCRAVAPSWCVSVYESNVYANICDCSTVNHHQRNWKAPEIIYYTQKLTFAVYTFSFTWPTSRVIVLYGCVLNIQYTHRLIQMSTSLLFICHHRCTLYSFPHKYLYSTHASCFVLRTRKPSIIVVFPVFPRAKNFSLTIDERKILRSKPSYTHLSCVRVDVKRVNCVSRCRNGYDTNAMPDAHAKSVRDESFKSKTFYMANCSVRWKL